MNLVPTSREIKHLLKQVKTGQDVPAVSLLRGLVHEGALAQGLSPRDAMELALDPSLTLGSVRIEVVNV